MLSNAIEGACFTTRGATGRDPGAGWTPAIGRCHGESPWGARRGQLTRYQACRSPPCSTNVLSRFTIFGGLFVIAAWLHGSIPVNSSPYVTQGVAKEQPVQFSHSITRASWASTVATVTRRSRSSFTRACAGHQDPVHEPPPQIWTNSEFLTVAPQLANDESTREGLPTLPQYAFCFNHGIHAVNKGVGCETRHGRRSDERVKEADDADVGCLDCHRQPEKYPLRPRQFIFSMDYQPPTGSSSSSAGSSRRSTTSTRASSAPRVTGEPQETVRLMERDPRTHPRSSRSRPAATGRSLGTSLRAAGTSSPPS